ncbi:hypothetical protein SSS_03573 [Sarcoptes scabiei]|nr:hypothetical protein SSS_03573 [Sarcoptes scabiei]
MTYRRNFPSISDTAYTSDSGWGCMLRCGQMVMARAFIILHLGRSWRWNYSDLKSIKRLLSLTDEDGNNLKELDDYLLYRSILKLFLDTKTAAYSIHQISLMGVTEGKNVGQWFGPNTIAQVLKKLSVFDKMNSIKIYVALDNIVFLKDISQNCSTQLIQQRAITHQESNDFHEVSNWKPLLLFIPLRLGLAEINPIYFKSLKTTFTFPQTLGILGGRPNHALYFIGCSDNDLIYLDPHTTQESVDLVDDLSEMLKTDRESIEDFSNDQPRNEFSDDFSYHCDRPYRISINNIDPSLSLCFFCKTEEDFNQWAYLCLHKLMREEQPLFEMMNERPKYWGINNDMNDSTIRTEKDELNDAERTNQIDPNECDEEFEIIE